MLVGGVVDDEVEDEPHVALLDAVEECVEVGHGAELGHDFLVVADVVAVVGVWGVVVGREPDDVDAELLEVVEAAGDAGDVADAVSVGVLEAAGVDLVDDSFLPPALGVAVGGGLGGLGVDGGGRKDEGDRKEGGERGYELHLVSPWAAGVPYVGGICVAARG